MELTTELQVAFSDIGKQLPQIWNKPILAPAHKKALLRCLIDKVVVQRGPRDQVPTRIVWKGGVATPLSIPVPVKSFADLSCAKELEVPVIKRSGKGKSDAEVAQQLTAMGYRSPMHRQVLPRTVQNIRVKHRILQNPKNSHPHRVPGYLTVLQVAQALKVPRFWIYDRIKNGRIRVTPDPKTGLYLFPDKPRTLELFKKLLCGKLHNLDF